jgi:cysteine-rich repeat protein
VLHLFANGTRNPSFSESGSLVLNATRWGLLQKFAVNIFDRMIVSSLILNSGISSASNILFPIITTNATIRNQTDIVVPPTEALVPKLCCANVVAFDTFSKRRYYLGSLMQASPVTNVTTFSILTLSTVTGRPDPAFGFRRSGQLVASGPESLFSTFLDSIEPLQDGAILFIYTSQASGAAKINVERRFSSYLIDSKFGLSGKVAMPQANFVLTGARTVLLSTGSLIVSARTADNKLWLSCIDHARGAPDGNWNVSMDGKNVTSTGSSATSIFSVEQIVPAVPWSSWPSFSFYVASNLILTPPSLIGAVFRFVSTGVPDSSFGSAGMSNIPFPNGFNQSSISSALVVPTATQFVYATGWISNAVNKSAYITRMFAMNGSIDSSWGANGFAIIRDIVPRSQGYGKKLFWDASLQRLVMIGGMAQPDALERVAVVTLNPENGSIECVSRVYDAFDGVGDAAQAQGFYLVSVKHSRAYRTIQFSSSDLSSTCLLSNICGDGVLNDSEQCDDHNRVDGDGCSSNCMIEPNSTCPYPGYACLTQG